MRCVLFFVLLRARLCTVENVLILTESCGFPATQGKSRFSELAVDCRMLTSLLALISKPYVSILFPIFYEFISWVSFSICVSTPFFKKKTNCRRTPLPFSSSVLSYKALLQQSLLSIHSVLCETGLTFFCRLVGRSRFSIWPEILKYFFFCSISWSALLSSRLAVLLRKFSASFS